MRWFRRGRAHGASQGAWNTGGRGRGPNKLVGTGLTGHFRHHLLKLPDGTIKVLVEGAQRAKVVKYTDCSEYYEAEAVALGDTMRERVEAEDLARLATTEFESYVKLNKKVPAEVVGGAQQIEDYAELADTIASHLALKDSRRHAILETTVVTERLEKVFGLMESEISKASGREAHPHPRQVALKPLITARLPSFFTPGTPT